MKLHFSGTSRDSSIISVTLVSNSWGPQADDLIDGQYATHKIDDLGEALGFRVCHIHLYFHMGSSLGWFFQAFPDEPRGPGVSFFTSASRGHERTIQHGHWSRLELKFGDQYGMDRNSWELLPLKWPRLATENLLWNQKPHRYSEDFQSPG